MENERLICFECEKCKNKLKEEKLFREIKEVNISDENDILYFLKYIECPKCKSVSFVQVDSMETKEIVSKIIKLSIRKHKMKVAGKPESKKIPLKVKRLNEELKYKRKEIAESLKGKEIVLESGNKVLFSSYMDFEF